MTDLFLRQAAHMEDPLRLVTPCCLENPLAPFAAAEIEGTSVSIDEIKKAFYTLCRSYDASLWKGSAASWFPVKKDYYVVDLAKEFSLPLLIVTRPGLGTINHTMLTVNYALEAGLEVAGIIINYSRPPENSLTERTNPQVLEEICPIPVIGTFSLSEKTMGEEVIEKLR